MPEYRLAKNTRIWIGDRAGANELELTAKLQELEIANPRIDLDSGLHPATGQLTLAGGITLGWTENLDPRSNRTRWQMGNQLRVQCQLSNDTWVPHPLGALRLLKRPKPPRGQDFVLSIGDDLAHLDQNPAPESSSGLLTASQVLSGIKPTEAINLLQPRTALPTLVDEIALTPVMHGIPARQSGTRVKQCGAISSAYLHLLWINGSRQLRAALCNVDRAPDFTLSTEDYNWDCTEGDFPEIDQVVVATTRLIKLDRDQADQSGSETDEGMTTTEAITDPYGTPVQTSSTTQPENEVFPTSSSTATITTGTTSKETNYTNDLFNYSLETSRACKGLLFPEDFPEDTTLTDARELKEQQVLTGDGKRVYKIVKTQREPAGLVDPSVSNKLALIKTRQVTKIWREHGDGVQWREQTVTWDLRERRITSPSRIGNYPPPQIQVKPQASEAVEQPDTDNSEANTSPPKTVLTLRRTSPVFGPGQAKAIATLQHRIEWGNALPAKWELPLSDSLIQNYHPFLMFDWIDNGVVYRYLSHSHVFLHSKTSSVVAMAGLFLGTVENGILTPALEVLT
ncbi:hypothetical protein [Vacuolonema iberomarrocanum]|uniref:hypothetical protein n=1 Tax=Vacuolonema iberomarrocanum TaxID=3454632 RepID=UPI0019E9DED3|nr:hypothetical protein [filamentous cyanobacterium LEGE 07170]